MMPQKNLTVQFSLTGFSEVTGYRVFAFGGVGTDRGKTEHTVRADLALTRKYGIRIQELPLLCRGILERSAEGAQQLPMTFTEDDMRLHAKTAADAHDAAIGRRKSARKVPIQQPGVGWRAPRP